ncbi:DUF922 domain-containing protein [Formosa algae]|uniref:DUF922 domain-containing protein n=1 Tax=Formosa algae TaxID=225843 RepID=UPI000CCE1745|nr:hypothetical protein [Formosa algae]PNW29050.1 hypothetical protein BKP44_05525 [Formosa algae]
MNHVIKVFFIPLFIILSYTTHLCAQTVDKLVLDTDEGIIWTANRKLKRTDFLGKATAEATGKALTGANIIIIPSAYKNGKYAYRVMAKFYKHLSWISTDSSAIIDHEQLHFDIAELFARKMRKEIHLIKRNIGQVSESDYRRIHKTVFQDYINYQRLYDAETKHSTLEDVQEKWNILIAEKLESLEDYTLNL